MNTNWQLFLNTQIPAETTFSAESSTPQIIALTQLSVLKISGADSLQFLQGQLTTNVLQLTEQVSQFSAMCSPKGRVIATFFLVKSTDAVLMILPLALLSLVKDKLSRYLFRAKVQLTVADNELCLIGLIPENYTTPLFHLEHDARPLFVTHTNEHAITIQIGLRTLVIVAAHHACEYWHNQGMHGYQVSTLEAWRHVDQLSGLPWLTPDTTEAFIPQMLNLDKIEGISFTKGCYTGQEIVARTHYLGKSKRSLCLAECHSATPLPAATEVFLSEQPNSTPLNACGQLLSVSQQGTHCTFLLVINHPDYLTSPLQLIDQTPVHLLSGHPINE
jgi:folate-binding protein YgfZ